MFRINEASWHWQPTESNHFHFVSVLFSNFPLFMNGHAFYVHIRNSAIRSAFAAVFFVWSSTITLATNGQQQAVYMNWGSMAGAIEIFLSDQQSDTIDMDNPTTFGYWTFLFLRLFFRWEYLFFGRHDFHLCQKSVTIFKKTKTTTI